MYLRLSLARAFVQFVSAVVVPATTVLLMLLLLPSLLSDDSSCFTHTALYTVVLMARTHVESIYPASL